MSKKYKFVFGGIVLCFFSLLVYSFYNKNFDFITYIAGLSSFFVALLTVVYVYTTNEQLKMMNKQLIQMETEQKQQQQPFPHMENIELEIEPPRFFYSPPEDEYSFQSRYRITANIINLTSEPAILLDIVATIDIPQEHGKIVLETTTKRIDVLAKDFNNGVDIYFLFPRDKKAKLFEALRNKKASQFPRLRICIYYRSLVGGCFKQTNSFYILPKETERINNWHILINSFETKYYEKLVRLRNLVKGDDLRDILFNEIKEDIKKRIGDDITVKLESLAISEDFLVEFLEEKEYVDAIKK